jgi:hypothetical protein
MKNKLFVCLWTFLVIGFAFVGCDTGTGGGLSLTIINNYSNPITKVEIGTANCSIDGLTALSETTSGPTVNRDYEYTTTIAPNASKTFSVTADGNTQGGNTAVTIAVTVEGLSWVWPTGSVFGTSYNRHYTAILYPDGVTTRRF